MTSVPTQPADPEPTLEMLPTRKAVAGAGAITLASRTAQTVISLVAIAVLARMLKPEHFGVAALALIVPEIIMMINMFGIPAALIQGKRPSRKAIGDCFRIAASRNVICMAIVIVAGIVLAAVYKNIDLFWLASMLSIGTFMTGATAPFLGLLQREMRFGSLALIQLIAMVFSVSVAIAAAMVVENAWPLVIQSFGIMMAVSVGRTAFGLPILRRLSPDAGHDEESVITVKRFGRNITLAKIIHEAADRLDHLVVGGIGGAAVLGLYSAARKWAFFPMRQTHLAMLNVGVTALSRAANDDHRFRSDLRYLQYMLIGLTFSGLAVLFIESQAIILIVLGPTWLDVIPLFQVMIIAAAARLPILTTKQAFYAEDRTDQHLRWTIAESIVMISAVTFGAFWGAAGVAYAYAGATVVLAPIALIYASHNSRARLVDYITPLTVVTFITAAAATVIWFARPAWTDAPSWLRVILTGGIFATFAAVMATLVALLHRAADAPQELDFAMDPADASMPSPKAASLKLSVVMPVYNGGEALGMALRGIRRSLHPPHEVIVVDDGSTDGASEKFAHLADNVLNSLGTNRGPAAARNRGVAAATGDIIVFIDADVIPRPDAIGRIAQLFADDESVAAMFGSYDNTPWAPGLVSRYRNLLHHVTHQRAGTQGQTFWSGLGAIRRTVFDDVHGFDESFAWIEDIDLGMRLHARGHGIRICREIQGTHLKRWTLYSMMRTDIFGRAVPWTKLLVTRGSELDHLNIDRRSQFSAVAAWGMLVSLPAIPFAWTIAGPVFGITLLSFVALQWPFFRSFSRARNAVFAAATLPLHMLYFMYSSATFAIVTLQCKLKPDIKQDEIAYTDA